MKTLFCSPETLIRIGRLFVLSYVWCLVLPLGAILKTTSSGGNWSNPSNWSPFGVPASGDKISIYHAITLDQNFTASDTIFVYNVLNFGSGKVLTLNPGILILVNTSQYDGKIGTMSSNSNISGNYIFQKWVTRCDGFSTYGFPFNTSTSDPDWYYCFRCQPSWSNLYCYNETQGGEMNNGYFDSIAGQIQRGRGFFYWYTNYNGGMNFPRKISLKGSTNFASSFDFGVTFTSSNGLADDGFNLIANPFPGTIDWQSGSWSKSKINNAIYTWNSCSGVYSSFVAGVSVNGGSRYISSMQGFWVQANGKNANLKISSGAMVNVSQTPLRQTQTEEVNENLLRLSLQGDEIAIRFDAASTSGYDSLTDALKFFSDNSTLCSGTPTGTLDFAINTLPLTSQTIPIKTKGGGVLAISGVSTFTAYSFFLKDLASGTSERLTENFHYTFTDTSVATLNPRFELQAILTDVAGLPPQAVPSLTVKTGDQAFTLVPSGLHYPVQVEVSNLLGQQLYSSIFEEVEINLPRWREPVIIRISDGATYVVKKVF